MAVLHLPRAPQRSIDSLVNWIKGTGSISRKEANFLERLDLCILGGSEGPTPAWIESCIERIIISVQQRFKVRTHIFRIHKKAERLSRFRQLAHLDSNGFSSLKGLPSASLRIPVSPSLWLCCCLFPWLSFVRHPALYNKWYASR